MGKESPSRRKPPSAAVEPSHLSHALAQLIALKGLARVRGGNQTQEIWRESCDADYADQTRALGIKGGVLHVAVSNSTLLGEIVSFHKTRLLQELQRRAPHLRIRELKFKVQGDMFK